MTLIITPQDIIKRGRRDIEISLQMITGDDKEVLMTLIFTLWDIIMAGKVKG